VPSQPPPFPCTHLGAVFEAYRSFDPDAADRRAAGRRGRMFAGPAVTPPG